MSANPGIDNQPPITGKRLNSSGDVVNVIDIMEDVYDQANAAIKTTATLTGTVTLGAISIKDYTDANYQAVNTSGEASVTIADGSDVTQGATTDAAVTNPASAASGIALLKGILTNTKATVLAAGTALIGKVSLQTESADVSSENPLAVAVQSSALPTGAATQTTLAAVNTATGAQADAAMTDETASGTVIACLKGIFAKIKALAALGLSASGFVSIDTSHNEIHSGNYYTATHLFTDVADTSHVYFRIKTGAKNAHGFFSVSVTGKCYTTTYSGTSYSAIGTEATTVNRNMNYPAANKSSIVYYAPTVDVLGSTRLYGLIPAGNTAQTRIGGTSSSFAETVVAPNTDVLLDIQNVSGAAADILVSVDWYEVAV